VEDLITFIGWVVGILATIYVAAIILEIAKPIFQIILFVFFQPLGKYFGTWVGTILICYFYFDFDFWSVVFIDAFILIPLGQIVFIYYWYPWAKEDYSKFSKPMQYNQLVRTDSSGNMVIGRNGMEKYDYTPIGRKKRKIRLKDWLEWWRDMIINYKIPALDQKISKAFWPISVVSFLICWAIVNYFIMN